VNTVSFRPRMLSITFTDDDFKGVDYRQDDPMVISIDVDKFTIMKTLVDQGSLVDILYPIFKILSKPDLAGRMIGWSVELSKFDIWYESRGAIKSQCLVDFSVELTPLPDLSAGWTLYVDDSSNKTACGAGVVLE